MPHIFDADSKHPLASKTVWVNALTIAVALLTTLGGLSDNIPAEYMPYIVSGLAAANVVLRFLTAKPLSVE